ncbi:MAG TPA: NAD(+)/NADH kinase [Anaerolineaceae bacterium]|nr:NAD(+)/NADH kinase [Anaerolineaceae bacterium]
MSSPNPPFKHIALIWNSGLPEAATESGEIAAFLEKANLSVAQGRVNDSALRDRIEQHEFNLVIALGGDGTMLRAGHLCGPVQVPILGVNMGRLGFLMETERKDWRKRLTQLLAGEYWLEKRMMLRAELWHAEQLAGAWNVLNEVFVGRGEQVRPVHLSTYLDDTFLTTYVADGLIAATPTGSTAYALAAGGPILPPELRNILIVPVAPHLSIDRAIVLAEGSSVSITVGTPHQAAISIDGQPPLAIADGDCVRVSASGDTVCFVRFQDPGYFYRNLTSHMNQNPSTGISR